ncbi:fibronectin type III domain-containing protein [Priestia megaterium]
MPLNEELLSKFTQNERGDLYFEDRLLVKKDIVNPEPVSNIQFTDITSSSVKVSFEASPSSDVAYYEVYYSEPAGSPINGVVQTTETTIEFTGLQESHSYEVWVTVVDTGDNKSQSRVEGFVTLPSDTEVPPVLTNAQIESRINEEGQLYYVFKDFKLTDTIDVYINDELKATLTSPDFVYIYADAVQGTFFRVKAVAKNAYGENEISINSYY